MRLTEEQFAEMQRKRGKSKPPLVAAVERAMAKFEPMMPKTGVNSSLLLVGFARPPAANNLFINAGRKRVIAPKYRAWREDALRNIRGQCNVKMAGPVSVTITVGKQDRRRADIDNCSKAMLDTLVHAGVLADDNFEHVFEVVTRWCFGVPETTVKIEQLIGSQYQMPEKTKKSRKRN